MIKIRHQKMLLHTYTIPNFNLLQNFVGIQYSVWGSVYCKSGGRPGFLKWAQKFLNLKKCAKTRVIGFKNFKNWAQTHTQRTYKNKILMSIESKAT